MRSPLKRKPLRNPGQSLDEKLDALIDDKLVSLLFVPGVFWILAGIEWFASVQHMRRIPGWYAVTALAMSIYGGWKVWRLRQEVRQIKQGRDGERAVGQYLEDLRTRGAKVFHDVVADGFNLDHVVICSKGVLVIETKTWSKPAGNPSISVRDGVVYRAGVAADRDVVGQVMGATHWLRTLLRDSTGEGMFVHPVLLFPGWWVEPMDQATQSVLWVLEPKQLPALISAAPDRMSREQVSMAAKHLGAWITR